MYRLLIVDDEEYVVNGLYETLSGEGLNLDIYRAYSGREALELLSRVRMDIVLSDVYMPEIDGLQLLEQIQKQWTQCKVIFLTGYNDFDSIYKATRYPLVGYLLKTESYERIIETVRGAIDEIARAAQAETLLKTAKEQTDVAGEHLRENFLRHLLGGDTAAIADAETFQALGIHLNPNQPLVMAVGTLNRPSEPGRYLECVERLNSVRRVIRSYLSPQVNSVTFTMEDSQTVSIVQPGALASGNIGGDMALFMEGTFEAIQNACQSGLNIEVSFSISGSDVTWCELAKRYGDLARLEDGRIGDVSKALLVEQAQSGDAERQDDADVFVQTLSAAFPRNGLLLECLESGQRDYYNELLDNVLEPMAGIAQRDEPHALEAYYRIAANLLSVMNRRKIMPRDLTSVDGNMLAAPQSFPSWATAADYLRRMSTELLDMQQQRQRTRADHTVSSLQTYILEHLDGDLSLVTLSGLVYLNPSYLSRIFRAETGGKLSDFINNSRLQRAKELLADENVRIAAIAQAIGYDSAASFSRFFRKACGVSPQAYRDQLLAAGADAQT